MGIEEYLTAPRQALAGCELLPAAQREGFLQATDNLIAAIKPHWHLNWQPRRLHGDCHPGNILWRDGPLFVDLDDARNGPAVQDLWMLLHGERRDQLMQLDVFLEAYGEFAEFDQRELALIEPLRAMRMVYYRHGSLAVGRIRPSLRVFRGWRSLISGYLRLRRLMNRLSCCRSLLCS